MRVHMRRQLKQTIKDMPRDRETVELFKTSPAPTRYRNVRKDKSEHSFDYRFFVTCGPRNRTTVLPSR
jgi:hypothetical protein